MALLSPSILSADFYRLGEEVEHALACGAHWMHVDVMDGHFVPQLTFGAKIVADIKKKQDVFCDVHLMVTNPEDHIDPFAHAGADLINFHVEAATHGDRLIQRIKEQGKQAGITINPATPVSVIEHYLPQVDLVLVMSVNPGFSGQKCIEYAFDKISQLNRLRKENSYGYKIEVDGGVSLKNVQNVLERGADVIVAGSGFFGVSDEEKRRFAQTVESSS